MQVFPQPEDKSATLAAPNDGAVPNGAPSVPPSDPKSHRALGEEELGAALQLLVERAQYITGATGAALALPHNGEMVCRASAGSCAPVVGARLQVRSGLTGESVSRRQLLRCDNAESDPRVNLEACRALGIASIVVLPLLRPNGEVRGLFELLSDHPYAFEERDLVALERMAGLTSTALDLAEQRHGSIPPARVVQPERPAEMVAGSAGQLAANAIQPAAATISPVAELPQPVATAVPQPADTAMPRTAPAMAAPPETSMVPQAADAMPSSEEAPRSEPVPLVSATAPSEPASASPVAAGLAVIAPAPAGAEPANVSVPPLTADVAGVSSPVGVPTELAAETALPSPTEDISALETPPTSPAPLPESMLRVRKCASCGFPVSEGRTLCLDCEKKRAEGRTDSPGELSAALAPTEDLPPFLANSLPAEESWLANHVNLLAILVFIVGILVAVVVFR